MRILVRRSLLYAFDVTWVSTPLDLFFADAEQATQSTYSESHECAQLATIGGIPRNSNALLRCSQSLGHARLHHM
jgi:hypothetical protein